MKYRNPFEERIAGALKGLCEYEPEQIDYDVKHKYTPDFVGYKGKWKIYIEAKGYFRVGDVQKYKAIRDSLDKSEELIWVLHNPHKPVRKGSKLTMSKWCEKENMRWFTEETVSNAFTT
tara:strand:+ start:7608 stop:7964 length:357 start_codon:yes stop_codon:yes gene_type:complete